jgi:hypothetical protein
MIPGRVYADFQNLDEENRVRLICAGTLRDLGGRTLTQGDSIALYTDDADDAGNPDPLLADGLVEFNDVERCWVARIDWSALRHASDVARPASTEQNGRTVADSGRPATTVDQLPGMT